jgi:DNA-directed RNA polymerase specialized sigma24 family protein
LRRILVENARSQAGGQRLGQRAEPFTRNTREFQDFAFELVALDEALSFLGKTNAMAEQLAQLRYFAGLTSQEAAEAMGISAGAADRTWGHARAWLLKQLQA